MPFAASGIGLFLDVVPYAASGIGLFLDAVPLEAIGIGLFLDAVPIAASGPCCSWMMCHLKLVSCSLVFINCSQHLTCSRHVRASLDLCPF